MTKLRNEGSVSGCSNLQLFKQGILGTVAIAGLCLFTQMAHAQDQADTEEVTVTGTRVQRDGYSAPTPVTVVGIDQIQASAPTNLADFVNQLPSVAGSSQMNNNTNGVSPGTADISALSLRNLGVNRTLVLLDGHRSSASASSGEVDINTFPQQLVNRIDVVTGGASADYGSDAVGGVVNFVLDKKYTGFKTDLEYGETTYGDQPNYKADLSWGGDFDGGRGHLLLSGEAFTSQGITGRNGIPRPWANNTQHLFAVQNANGGTGGQPYFIVANNAVPSQVAPGGLVVSGPLMGTYFGVNGAVGQLAYGTLAGQWMLGGDQTTTCQNYCNTSALAPSDFRTNAFGRASYQLTDDIEVYGQASIARSATAADYQISFVQTGGVTIQSDNAFLPASVKTAMANAHVTSLTIGTTNQGLPPTGSREGRVVERFLAGADGTFDFLGHWKFDAYGQEGLSNLHERVTNAWQTQNMALAQDAVVVTAANVGTSGLALGSVACRSTLKAPTNGCMPLSRIGINGGLQSPAAYAAGKAYVYPAEPFRVELLRETDFGFNISGEPFENWAGPVSVAFGGEWRLESINGRVNPYFNANWSTGNFLVNHGHYSVGEGYIETVVPLMQGMDATGAIRYTAYSTSGGVNTWKAGWNYQVIDDLKFRVTYSHDIRAPNLAELFAAGTARSNTVTINNQPYAFVQNTTGNPNVTPEAANSLGAGVVLTPTFIPGLAMSVDYYNISIAHQIASIQAQSVANLCYQLNVTSYCQYLHSTGSLANGTFALSTIDLKPINYVAVKAEGIDFDLTYNVPLEEMNWFGEIPGDLLLHGLATNYMSMYVNDGLNPPTEQAGAVLPGSANVGGGMPNWVYRGEAIYKTDDWTFNLIGHGFGPWHIQNEFTVCSTNCPISTPANRTINSNNAPAAFYLDATINHAFQAWGFDSEVFFTVKNMFNTAPGAVPNGAGFTNTNTAEYPQTDTAFYDLLGRVFRIGVRANM